MKLYNWGIEKWTISYYILGDDMTIGNCYNVKPPNQSHFKDQEYGLEKLCFMCK